MRDYVTAPDPGGTVVGLSTTIPVVHAECGTRLQHTIDFIDSATPTRKAKPAGVLAAEIWVSVLRIGQPTPGDLDTSRFVALDTQTPYTLDFDAADGWKNAHYLLRWVNSTGQKVHGARRRR